MNLPTEHSHIIDCEKIKKEAFLLLNLGYGFLRLRDDDEGDVKYRQEAHIFQSFGRLYSQEVSSILTSISISGRMLDDIIKKNRTGTPAIQWNFEEMLGDDEEGNWLTLRDCFNKIIHAERIDHELMQLPEVYLTGRTQQKKEWAVRVFLIPFCTSVFQWVEEFNIAQQSNTGDAKKPRP